MQTDVNVAGIVFVALFLGVAAVFVVRYSRTRKAEIDSRGPDVARLAASFDLAPVAATDTAYYQRLAEMGTTMFRAAQQGWEGSDGAGGQREDQGAVGQFVGDLVLSLAEHGAQLNARADRVFNVVAGEYRGRPLWFFDHCLYSGSDPDEGLAPQASAIAIQLEHAAQPFHILRAMRIGKSGYLRGVPEFDRDFVAVGDHTFLNDLLDQQVLEGLFWARDLMYFAAGNGNVVYLSSLRLVPPTMMIPLLDMTSNLARRVETAISD